ncbi:zincin, partial [Auricularia subglabra TFB-10046 SS5]
PQSVPSVEGVHISVNVRNEGSHDIKVLRYDTVLDNEHGTQPFVVNRDGREVIFTGISVQLDFRALDDTAFTFIPAGGVVNISHDLSALYDFESHGPGNFSFEPITTFLFADQLLYDSFEPINVAAPSISLEITGDVARREHGLLRRATLSCDDAESAAFIAESYKESRTLAQLTSAYIANQGSDAVFKTYFGTSSTSVVGNVYTQIAEENNSTITLFCVTPPSTCAAGLIAYAAGSAGKAWFCPAFFTLPSIASFCDKPLPEARLVRSGTLLHELTHIFKRTVDYGYGCFDFDQKLALSDPEKASNNADTYNCFAGQVYANTQC